MNEIKVKALEAALEIHRAQGYGDAGAVIAMAHQIENYLVGRDEMIPSAQAPASNDAPTVGTIQ